MSNSHVKSGGGLIWIALIALAVGEAVFTVLHQNWPGLYPFTILIAVYYAVKLVGDLLSLLTKRVKHEWRYIDGYVINELIIGWSFFAIPLAFAQSVPMLLFPADSLPWRACASALLAALSWLVMRRKKELELTLTRQLGRRVRAKYDLGGGE